MTRSDPCISVLSSGRAAFCASRALCPQHCWRCILRPLSPLTHSTFLACESLTGCCSGQRLAFVAYESSLWIFVAGPASSHSHHFWRVSRVADQFPVSLQRLWHPRLPCLPLLPRIQTSKASSLPRTDGRIETAVPIQTTLVQTPLLSWLRLHLSAHPLVYSEPLSKVLRALSRHMNRDLAMCRIARLPRMSFCCIQQSAANQRLPQPDWGCQAIERGAHSPQEYRVWALLALMMPVRTYFLGTPGTQGTYLLRWLELFHLEM